jgi:L-ascorbate metabolism protein UlaG (beta-lactamase superfamily)
MSIELTWFGHATVLVEDRARVLTDPLLTGTLLHLRRRAGEVPPSLTGRLDAVALSHLHIDHLHLPSLALLDPGTPVLVPRGAARLLRRLPLEPVEVVAGDTIAVRDAELAVVPAAHDATRWPLGRTRGEAVGYVLRGAGSTYFAGDTATFAGMRDLPSPFDVALLPVGGWGPWLRGQHLDPEDAASCLPTLRPRVCVPIHYGTFWPRGVGWLRKRIFFEPGREFAEHARITAPEVDVRVLPPGGTTEVLSGPAGDDPAS